MKSQASSFCASGRMIRKAFPNVPVNQTNSRGPHLAGCGQRIEFYCTRARQKLLQKIQHNLGKIVKACGLITWWTNHMVDHSPFFRLAYEGADVIIISCWGFYDVRRLSCLFTFI